MTYEEIRPLLAWRRGHFKKKPSAVVLARALTCEGLPHHELAPAPLRECVVGFRHRRSDARVAMCSRFLAETKR